MMIARKFKLHHLKLKYSENFINYLCIIFHEKFNFLSHIAVNIFGFMKISVFMNTKLQQLTYNFNLKIN